MFVFEAILGKVIPLSTKIVKYDIRAIVDKVFASIFLRSRQKDKVTHGTGETRVKKKKENKSGPVGSCEIGGWGTWFVRPQII